MPKHTPGPWFIGRGEGDGEPVIVHSEHETICVLDHNPTTGLNADANGRLIAAAPLLFEACHAAFVHLMKIGFIPGSPEEALTLQLGKAVSTAEVG